MGHRNSDNLDPWEEWTENKQVILPVGKKEEELSD